MNNYWVEKNIHICYTENTAFLATWAWVIVAFRRGELPLTLSTTTLNPRARENTPFYRARYFRQRLGSPVVCLHAWVFFQLDGFKENATGARSSVSLVIRKYRKITIYINDLLKVFDTLYIRYDIPIVIYLQAIVKFLFFNIGCKISHCLHIFNISQTSRS